MKVATDHLVQGFVAATGGEVEAPQRRPDSMTRHQEFEARLAFVRYAEAVEHAHRSYRRFAEGNTRPLDLLDSNCDTIKWSAESQACSPSVTEQGLHVRVPV
eukprot:4277634-Prymnesium_polylepis.1